MSTTFFATYAPRRAMAGGTTRKPPAAKSKFSNFAGTLSKYRVAPPCITRLSSRRKESSTAFLIHSCVTHLPPLFFGHPELARVEPGDDLVDRLAQGARCVSGVEGASLLPGLLD